MDLLLIELVPLAQNLATNPLPLKDTVFLDSNSPPPKDLDHDSLQEAMYYRLESLGFRVGQGIAERYEI
jgi:trafficking protein particle complex subunit 6